MKTLILALALLPVAAAAPPATPSLAPIYFERGTTALTTAQREILEDHAAALRRRPGRVRVVGHTDDRGTAEYNLALGRRMAEAVKRHLVKLGVAARRLVVVSRGEEAPVCREKTPACRDRNRRVELVLE